MTEECYVRADGLSAWPVSQRNHGADILLFSVTPASVSDFVQVMIKSYAGYIQDDARSLNNVMSRIRIYIKKSFADSANTFSYLSYKNGLRLGGRMVQCVYEVANFLMNVRR